MAKNSLVFPHLDQIFAARTTKFGVLDQSTCRMSRVSGLSIKGSQQKAKSFYLKMGDL